MAPNALADVIGCRLCLKRMAQNKSNIEPCNITSPGDFFDVGFVPSLSKKPSRIPAPRRRVFGVPRASSSGGPPSAYGCRGRRYK